MKLIYKTTIIFTFILSFHDCKAQIQIDTQSKLLNKVWKYEDNKSPEISFKFTTTKEILYVNDQEVQSIRYYILNTNCDVSSAFDLALVGMSTQGNFFKTEDGSCYTIEFLDSNSFRIMSNFGNNKEWQVFKAQ